MQIKKIQDGNFEGKKVLVRADFNVGIVEGKIQEQSSISQDYLIYLRAKRNLKI